MTQAPTSTETGFQSAKARWPNFVWPAAFALWQALATDRAAHGDWSRILHATPFALAFCAVAIGVWSFVGLLRKRPATGGWKNLSAGGFSGLGALRWTCVAIALFFFGAQLSLGPPGGLAWNWRPVALQALDWKLDGLFILAIVAFTFLVNWWLRFVERDRARAAAKDRLNMGLSAGAAHEGRDR